MDFCRIDRLTEIGGDWGGQFRPVNAVPMRQLSPNLRPIETPFWIGDISSIRENRGQSYAMQEPIRCQSWLSQTDNLLPIQCQSVTSRLPIQCRCLANPVTILCQSIPNPVTILCQYLPNPVPIWCQSVSNSLFNPAPIHHQSIADRTSIDLQFWANMVPIQCQSDVILRPMGCHA